MSQTSHSRDIPISEPSSKEEVKPSSSSSSTSTTSTAEGEKHEEQTSIEGKGSQQHPIVLDEGSEKAKGVENVSKGEVKSSSDVTGPGQAGVSVSGEKKEESTSKGEEGQSHSTSTDVPLLKQGKGEEAESTPSTIMIQKEQPIMKHDEAAVVKNAEKQDYVESEASKSYHEREKTKPNP